MNAFCACMLLLVQQSLQQARYSALGILALSSDAGATYTDCVNMHLTTAEAFACMQCHSNIPGPHGVDMQGQKLPWPKG